MAILPPGYLDHFAVADWLRGTDLYRTLSDEGIGDEKFDQMTDDIFEMYGTPDKTVPGTRPMNRNDIMEVFKSVLHA